MPAPTRYSYLGICLGMQTAVISFARDVLGLADANPGNLPWKAPTRSSTYSPDQREDLPKGGTMRLGAYPPAWRRGTKLSQVYGGAAQVAERHRHRYEFVNTYRAPTRLVSGWPGPPRRRPGGGRRAHRPPPSTWGCSTTGIQVQAGQGPPAFAAFVRACLEVNHP